MERNIKNQKGITLVALVITIIVMLILVAVSVTVAINGGLFTKAKEAGNEWEDKSAEEAAGNIVNVDGTITTIDGAIESLSGTTTQEPGTDPENPGTDTEDTEEPETTITITIRGLEGSAANVGIYNVASGTTWAQFINETSYISETGISCGSTDISDTYGSKLYKNDSDELVSPEGFIEAGIYELRAP